MLAQKIINQKFHSITLLQCYDENQEQHYFYLLTRLDKLEQLNSDIHAGKCGPVSSYGEILMSGKGIPSPLTRTYMKESYNFDESNIVELPDPITLKNFNADETEE